MLKFEVLSDYDLMRWITINHRRLITWLLISTLVIFFLFPELQKRPVDFLLRPFTYTISTLQEGLIILVQGIGSVWSGHIALTEVREENLSLHEELSRLKNENIQLLESKAALDRMEALLEFKEQSSHQIIAARVVGRDPTNWNRMVVIDKGERDGVAVDMGVSVSAGVVGRVIKTTPEFSRVLLLTDRNSAIAVFIQRTRDEGLVEGTEKGLARIKYLSMLSELNKGDLVLTSGLAGSFPKGLLIGRIDRWEKRETALFQQAEVIPEVDLSKLEEVMVIALVKKRFPENDKVSR